MSAIQSPEATDIVPNGTQGVKRESIYNHAGRTFQY
jgi:hypothetical protein